MSKLEIGELENGELKIGDCVMRIAKGPYPPKYDGYRRADDMDEGHMKTGIIIYISDDDPRFPKLFFVQFDDKTFGAVGVIREHLQKVESAQADCPRTRGHYYPDEVQGELIDVGIGHQVGKQPVFPFFKPVRFVKDIYGLRQSGFDQLWELPLYESSYSGHNEWKFFKKTVMRTDYPDRLHYFLITRVPNN